MTERIYTAAEKLACAQRELRMRERVYPKWVADQRITQKGADHEIGVMRAIAEDYERQAEGERLL